MLYVAFAFMVRTKSKPVKNYRRRIFPKMDEDPNVMVAEAIENEVPDNMQVEAAATAYLTGLMEEAALCASAETRNRGVVRRKHVLLALRVRGERP